MATSSDGGDNYVPSALSNSLNNGTSSGDMRFYLQSLLDDKEKQLQQAGTLGQQLLAQRMELDDTVKMLQEMLDVGDGDEVRDKLRELDETIRSWDAENEQLSVPLGVKVNGRPTSPPAEVSRGNIARTNERTKASATGTTAAQSSRRAKNAAHRANDVEFALDIGNGLLLEVRRLQALLTEREQALQDMKEFKDDLEKTVESLRAALREQEQFADKYKEENWNLEVTIQELRTQHVELQATTQRLEGEQKKLTKALTTTRESADHYKTEVERVQGASDEQKQKHDTTSAQYRRQIAGLQRQIFDLQQTNESTKAELAKAQRKSPRFLAPTTPNGLDPSTVATPANEDGDDPFGTTGGASTRNRSRMDSSALFPLDDYDYANESPDASPSRPFFAPNHPSNEIEALQQRLAHAQRQINTLKSSLQREKEMRIDYKRKLDAAMAKSDEEEEGENEEEEARGQSILEESKSKPRLTPFRVGRGRGRGRGRGGMTLLQRLAAHSPSSEYGADDKDEDSSPPPPVPPLPAIEPLEAEDDEDDTQQSPSLAIKSNRTSVDGMDPAFANVLRRSSSSRFASPLRHSVFSRPNKSVPRRSRGGAAYQQARPPSFTGEPEALANELGQLGFSMDSITALPEAAKETIDAGCQTDFEEAPVPSLIVTQPSAPSLPSPDLCEFGVQVEPEPVVLPESSDASMQTEVEFVPPSAEIGIQHEDLSPRVVLVSTAVATEPELEPEVIEVEAHPAPILVQAEVQTLAPSVSHAEMQTLAPSVSHAEMQTLTPSVSHTEMQTLPEAMPETTEIDIQTETLPTHYADVQTQAVAATFDADIQADVPTENSDSVKPVEAPTPVFTPKPLGTQMASTSREMEVQTLAEVRPQIMSREMSTATDDDESADNTITIRRSVIAGEPVFDDDDGTQTETASMMETDTDEYVDARQSMSLVTPTESLEEDYHSIMTVTDNDFSESSDDGESIKASRLPSRQGTPSSAAALEQPPAVLVQPVVSYESKAVSADLLPTFVELPAPEVPPKPEVKEMSIQTDEWVPPAPLASPAPVPPASPTPSVFRIGPPSQQFQFISPPPSAGPTTISLPNVAAPSPQSTLRDSATSFIPRPRTSHSDRRQSIESTLSAAIVDDVFARSRTPSNVTNAVDKSRPPMMVLPPPPRQPPPPGSMAPPQFIPEKRQSAVPGPSHDVPPPRPTSPPPADLIQRATTPTFGSVLSVPGSRQFGLRHQGSNLPVRQPSSTSSFRSTGNTLSRPPQSSPSALSYSIRERERREMSTTSLTSGDHMSGGRSESQHSSVSSERYEQEQRSQEVSGTPDRTVRPAGGSTDPTVIHAITQTMIGEFLYKYTRKTIGKGHGEKRHKRFFWVHPYTRTLYWSSADPGSANVSESSAKSGTYFLTNFNFHELKDTLLAYIEAVRAVMDPNPMPPGIHQYSVIVSTPHREMKFTAPTKERHEIWVNALQYLLTRPAGNPMSPAGPGAAPHSPLSAEAELSEVENARRPGTFASPQSQRSVRTSRTGISVDSWNSTPRGQRSHSQLSQRSSMGKRSGTPAAEYLRWNGPDAPYSPTRDFEHIPGQDDGDLDFELNGDSMSDEGFEGLENVRACCDGRHTVGRSGKIIHHHHHHHNHSSHEPPRPHTAMAIHLDPNPHDIPPRPVSPAWSFRSRAGSTHSTDGQGFFSRFGTRRSKATTADRR
ncbi:hypothetical protein EIP86_009684 [Pleurotus ostreatoroseus]|nr:hypothetical protein EIP86_009684 [Pleurotus ostreatoroseus]